MVAVNSTFVGSVPAQEISSSSGRRIVCPNEIYLEDTINFILDSTVYQVLFALFTFVLLFGAQIQELAFEKEHDIGFDILFLITFCFLSIDTAMRAVVDPTYGLKADPNAKIAARQHRWRSSSATQDESTRLWLPYWCSPPSNWRFGSFLFWWDVLSVLTLFYDIEIVNFMENLRETQITIKVDMFGSPVS